MEVIYSKDRIEESAQGGLSDRKLFQFLDTLVYIVACIGSFGLVWLLRIIITTGIKKAFKNGA